MSGTPSELKATLVEAGAGTGKTQSLAERIVRTAQVLYESSGSKPKFVATTFTERATAELRERVISVVNRDPGSPDWLKEFAQNQEHLFISTIHGVLSLLLHRYGVLVGLDPDFLFIKSKDEKQKIGEVLRRVIAKDSSYGMVLDHYSFYELVDLVQGLVGHSRTHKGQFNFATGWENLAQREVIRTIEALQQLTSQNFEDLPPKATQTLAILKNLGQELSPTRSFSENRALLLSTLEGVRRPSAKQFREFGSLLDQIFDESKKAWAEPKYSPEINERYEEVAPLLQKMVQAVESLLTDEKEKAGVLTFDDLEFYSEKLITDHPMTLESWRDEWDFWFIDEFQDTSPLQEKILTHFFGSPWNAYFVGDPQQSIYLFRGSDQSVFNRTKENVTKIQGNLERLQINYRSQPDLLKFINLAFSKLSTPLDPLEPKGPYNGKIMAQVNLTSEGVEEGDVVAKQVQKWRDEGVSYQDIAVLVRKNAKAKNIGHKLSQLGIPVYVHSSGGFYDRREVTDALGLIHFLEDPHDDKNFLLLARSPFVGASDLDLVRWADAKGSQTFWAWISNQAEIRAEFFSLRTLSEALIRSKTTALSEVFNSLLVTLGFYEFCLVGDSSGRREANLRKLVRTLQDEEKKVDFSAGQFLREAWEEVLEEGEEKEAASFIEPQKVNVMTIHMSKGLKFSHVIIPYCGEGFRIVENALELAPNGSWAMRVLSPDAEEKVGPLVHSHLREGRFQRENAEFLRVLYVAMTRAADRLSLIGSSKFSEKSWFGQLKINYGPGTQEGCYDVITWDEPLTLEKAQEIKTGLPQESRVLRPLKQKGTAETYSVTQLSRRGGAQPPSLSAQLEAQSYGQALHWVFENLDPQSTRDLRPLCQEAQKKFGLARPLDEKSLSKCLNWREPPLKSLLTTGFREWPFSLKHEGLLLRGQIDLWGEVDGHVWIVDYKSFSKLSESKIDEAKRQLEFYALAVSALGYSFEKIRLALVTPLSGEFKLLPLNSKEFVGQNLSIDLR